MPVRRFLIALAFTSIWILESTAQAQVIGTFTWQTQPHCNRVTLLIVQQGSVFHLSGADDLCGGGVAPVTGTAVVAGNTVALGMTVSLPSGRSEHLTATITVPAVSGTWNDADGHTGTFAFGVAAPGPPRPAPATAAFITSAQLTPAIFSGTGTAPTIAHSDHLHDARYAGRQIVSHVSPFALMFPGSEQVGTVNGCPTSIAGAAGGIVPLEVPSGATVSSVRAVVLDFIGTYTLSLWVDSLTATGLTSVIAATVSANGAPIATVSHTLVPASPITIGPGTSLNLGFATGGSFGNGLCAVEVTYTLPPAS